MNVQIVSNKKDQYFHAFLYPWYAHPLPLPMHCNAKQGKTGSKQGHSMMKAGLSCKCYCFPLLINQQKLSKPFISVIWIWRAWFLVLTKQSENGYPKISCTLHTVMVRARNKKKESIFCLLLCSVNCVFLTMFWVC